MDPAGRTDGAWRPGARKRIEGCIAKAVQDRGAQCHLTLLYSKESSLPIKEASSSWRGAWHSKYQHFAHGQVVLFFLYMMASNEVNFTWSSAPTAAHARSHSGTI